MIIIPFRGITFNWDLLILRLGPLPSRQVAWSSWGISPEYLSVLVLLFRVPVLILSTHCSPIPFNFAKTVNLIIVSTINNY